MMNENLKVFNTDVIPVYTTDDGIKVVLGRELYERLYITERYSRWFDRMAGYGFVEGKDYTPYQMVHPQNFQRIDDYILSLDMAKHIAMIQRSPEGMEIRQKLIDLEKKVSEGGVVAEALCNPESIAKILMAYSDSQKKNAELAEKNEKLTKRNQKLQEKNEYLTPRADYCESVLQSNNTYAVTDIAKEYGWTAARMNKKLHELGIQFKCGSNWHLYSNYDGMGLIEYETRTFYDRNTGKERRSSTMRWTERGKACIYDHLKKEGILPRSEASRKVKEG